MSFLNKKYLKKTFDTFTKKCDAMFLIYNENNTYEMVFGDEVFSSLIEPSGSLFQLYKILFMHKQQDNSEIDEKYQSFINTSLFHMDNYSNNITIHHNEKGVTYFYRVLKLYDEAHVIYFMKSNSASSETENLKLNVMQQNYLFSMMVNFSSDTCSYSNTPELSGHQMDYLDMKYSHWRFVIAEMFLPEDRESFLSFSDPNHLMDILSHSTKVRRTFKMRNMDGEYIWSRLCYTRVNDFSKENPIAVYTVEDIQEDMENFLNHSQSDNNLLLSQLTHELRTPLTAVLGFSDVILKESQDDFIRKYATDIKSSGNMLLTLMNNILDFSRLEAGKMEIIPTTYSVQKLLQDSVSMVSLKAQEKGLELFSSIDDTVPDYLYGDDIRIKQILINLLNNAVKYTREGHVSLNFGFSKNSQNTGNLLVTVKDTGVGMKSDDMDKLFAAYERIDEGMNRDIEGTGLGMTIVISLLQQMDSKLEIDSVFGEGTTFSFALPQDIPEKL